MARSPQIVFGGDREIAVKVLKFLLKQNCKPLALLVSDTKTASHASPLRQLCNHLDDEHILKGVEFRKESGLKLLKEIQPDYVV